MDAPATLAEQFHARLVMPEAFSPATLVDAGRPVRPWDMSAKALGVFFAACSRSAAW